MTDVEVFSRLCVCVLLTLVYMQKGVCKFGGEHRFRQIPEVLFNQVSHIVGRLALVGHMIGGILVELPEGLDAGFNSGFPK